MDGPIQNYWRIRLGALKETLEANNFEAYLADNTQEAKAMVLEEILPKSGAKTISWGSSMTFIATGLYDEIKNLPGLEVLDTFDKNLSPRDGLERRRQALLSDLFIMGANAVTETGMLVNLDMTGNRVAALTFGPKSVIVLAGRNKVVPELEDAMLRIKNYAAPVNAKRLSKNTPCVQTSYCEECKSKDRICNTWTITEKSFPKGRIKVVLINEDLGL